MIARAWKAVASLVVGLANWANLVIQSDEGNITKQEWSVLIGVLLATAGVFLVTNAPAPAPAPPPPE